MDAPRGNEWSYDLLQPEEQELFVSLAVFVAGFTLAAAEHVAEQPHLDILEGVETLHRNSLLTTEHARGDEPRLGMRETMREYALERLAARGDEEAMPTAARRLLRRSGGGGRAGSARPAATRVARAPRLRARQHPRRAQVGAGYRRGGGGPENRAGRSGASGSYGTMNWKPASDCGSCSRSAPVRKAPAREHKR